MNRPPPGKISSQVRFLTGHGELPLLEILTPWSTAEIYLHGAHVTRFQKQAEPPLLFLSQASRFQAGQPIRGGVPIIFPWFGARVGAGQHGFARNRTWQLKDVATNQIILPPGQVSSLQVRLSCAPLE